MPIRLEDVQPNAAVRDILPDCLVTVVSVQWFGSEALEPRLVVAVEELVGDLTGRRLVGQLEVKRRAAGAVTITVTKNEILYSLNKPDDFILAIVEFLDDVTHRVHYVRRPFHREPDFGVTSVDYDFAKLIARAEEPS